MKTSHNTPGVIRVIYVNHWEIEFVYIICAVLCYTVMRHVGDNNILNEKQFQWKDKIIRFGILFTPKPHKNNHIKPIKRMIIHGKSTMWFWLLREANVEQKYTECIWGRPKKKLHDAWSDSNASQHCGEIVLMLRTHSFKSMWMCKKCVPRQS